jgi:putative protease
LNRPEILAPAGDRDALEAAVRAGADAVYFGLQGFNARARASNFDSNELMSTMRYLHERGVRGYVTLNTLVFDQELASMEAAVRACAAAGVDAVIVQDLGVAKLVRSVAPGLPIHASTQMTCTDRGAVELAKELGASRVILARELSIAEIAKIREATDVEVEVFVHGALCISYSGQCLTSEAIGGRSANRGACAQSCRLPYTLIVDGNEVDTDERAYLLSPEDLEASEVVPELVRLGVSALKIEGRLKGPEYVGATTRLYRKSVDAAVGEGPSATNNERRTALQTFTRGSGPGFLRGVDHQRLVEGRACDHRGLEVGRLRGAEHRKGKALLAIALGADLARGDGILVEGGHAGEGEVGGRVWAIEVAGKDVPCAGAGELARVWLGPDVRFADLPASRRVFKTSDPPGDKRIQEMLAHEARRIELDLRLSGSIGEPFVLEGRTATGAWARVTGDAPLDLARTAALDEAALRDKLGRLGDSPFVLRSLEVAWPANTIVPLSSLNRARRALVAALAQAAVASHGTTATSHGDLLDAAAPPDRAPAPPGLFVLCRTLEQAHAAIDSGARGVYLDFLELTGTGDALRALRKSGAFVGVAPPRIRKPDEDKIDRYIASLEPDAILVRGLGALREVAEGKRTLAVGDFSLNVTNRLSAAEVLGRNLDAFTPSFDLDAAQLLELLRSPFGAWAEVVVHHPMALFHMEHCVIAALLSEGSDHKTCGRPCEAHRVSLRDRAGMDHPVEADVGCRNTVFHARPQSAVQLIPELLRARVGRFRIEVVRESPDEVRHLVRSYARAIESPSTARDVWRDLRTELGYGVVRGSLRVLESS